MSKDSPTVLRAHAMSTLAGLRRSSIICCVQCSLPQRMKCPGRNQTAHLALLLALAAALTLPRLAAATDSPMSASELGRALFFDPDLSISRTQSCASCHSPAHAFMDARDNGVAGAASRGHDGRLLGDRNTPSIAYAGLIPRFAREPSGQWAGGLFLDGRAATLEIQAAEPLTNALEMALPDHAAVVARVAGKPVYVKALSAIYGARVFDSTASAMHALTAAIASFERGPPFLSFDSRYDRYLRGEYTMTMDEELGRRLFFSDLTNCMQCHLLDTSAAAADEPFTNYRHHNIGVPANPRLDAALGAHPARPDLGLGRRGDIADPGASGRFRTPTLRNVAVTAPYMHNGVFQDLRTAIKFYNQYIVANAEVGINPETGAPWGAPEVALNIETALLRQGQPLADDRVDLLVAFLRTLTDRRYEHLLSPRGESPSCRDTAEEEQCNE